jgi:hypothetical protein
MDVRDLSAIVVTGRPAERRDFVRPGRPRSLADAAVLA